MTTAGGMKVSLPADHVGECVRVDMPRPALPQERILNGDFGLLGSLWNILSGGWAIALNLATNLGLGLGAAVTQTFAAPWTSPSATLQIDVSANLLGLSVLHVELVTDAGVQVLYVDNPGPGIHTVAGIVISSPAQSIRIYVTGVAGIVLNSVSLVG